MIGRELNLLFWNLAGKELSDSLAKVSLEHNSDIIVVAEAGNLDKSAFLDRLNETKVEYFDANAKSLSDKVFFFTKFYPEYIDPISEDDADRYSFRILRLPATKELIIGGVHLLDQRNYEETDRFSFATIVKREIDRIEEENGIEETVIIGDFNMNPFEKGMSNALGFNATLARKVAERISTTVLKQKANFFYNPSWSLMGDLYSEPAGTYYYNKPGYESRLWNVFDQAIIRPSLIENFVNEEYEIITTLGVESLLTGSGQPNKKLYSDHLPIKMKLKNL